MNSIYNETKFIMKKYGIKANKSLGQNFLIDDNAIETIVNSANISKNDLVIEIGPGLGTLTSNLLEKAGKVICVELDDRMINILQDRFKLYDNFKLIHEDILKLPLKDIIEKEKKENNFKSTKIVANLPYYITTPIIMKLLEYNLPIESITVMVQKEVADRLTATPGDKNTGAITYSIDYYCNAKEILFVPNTSFIPAPEVNSEVIQLEIRKEPPVTVKNEKFLFNIVKTNFMQRRKTLLNALVNGGIASKFEIENVLNSLNISTNIRGEKLTLEQFALISNLLQKK